MYLFAKLENSRYCIHSKYYSGAEVKPEGSVGAEEYVSAVYTIAKTALFRNYRSYVLQRGNWQND